ncbi:MAG: DUF6702 family protein [Pseudomonadota bacterium]
MIRLFAGLIALLMVAAPSAAHQQKVSTSTVEHNSRTGLLEVIHRISLHDAEHALRAQGKSAADIVDDVPSRRAFARYVAERFSVTVEGQPLDLTILGSEIDGGNLFIYQEARSPGIGTVLTVQSQILTDIWAKQVNRVNIGRPTSPTTLIFRQGEPAKSGRLE